MAGPARAGPASRHKVKIQQARTAIPGDPDARTAQPFVDQLVLERRLLGVVDLFVLKWFTPLEGLGGEIFRVERDGIPVPYEGPLAMRADPSADDYVHLAAGATLSATVDLAAAFDLSEPGTYTIAFLSPNISHVAVSEERMATSLGELGPVSIPSDPINVTIGVAES